MDADREIKLRAARGFLDAEEILASLARRDASCKVQCPITVTTKSSGIDLSVQCRNLSGCPYLTTALAVAAVPVSD